MKAITDGDTEIERLFAAAQETVGKNLERAIGVLVVRFQILLHGCQLRHRRDMSNVIKACFIIRARVVEAGCDNYKSGIVALEFYDDINRMFQQFAFEWHFRKGLEGRTGTPLTEEVLAASVLIGSRVSQAQWTFLL